MNFKALTLLAGLTFASLSFGQSFVVDSDYMTYDNVQESRYATLADAQAGVNALGTYSLGDFGQAGNPRTVGGSAIESGRDLYLGMVNNKASYATNFAAMYTAWYFTTTANGNGWGNPNNTDTGFVQFYDSGSTVTNWGAQWDVLNAGVAGASTFSFSMNGANALAGSANQYGRLWAAPEQGGASGDTAANLISYSIAGTVTGLTANDDGTGFFYATGAPGTVSGTLKVIGENVSTTNPANNGFYVMTATLGSDSWSVANGATWSDASNTYGNQGFYGSTQAVPEPSTFALFGLGAAGFLAVRRKRNR